MVAYNMYPVSVSNVCDTSCCCLSDAVCQDAHPADVHQTGLPAGRQRHYLGQTGMQITIQGSKVCLLDDALE